MARSCRHLSHSFTLDFRSIPRAAYFQMMLPRKSKQCRAAMIYLTMNHSLKNYQLWKAFTTLGIMQWCVSCESVRSVSMATPTQPFANSWGNLPGRVAENKPAYCGFSKGKWGLFRITSRFVCMLHPSWFAGHTARPPGVSLPRESICHLHVGPISQGAQTPQSSARQPAVMLTNACWI